MASPRRANWFVFRFASQYPQLGVGEAPYYQFDFDDFEIFLLPMWFRNAPNRYHPVVAISGAFEEFAFEPTVEGLPARARFFEKPGWLGEGGFCSSKAVALHGGQEAARGFVADGEEKLARREVIWH